MGILEKLCTSWWIIFLLVAAAPLRSAELTPEKFDLRARSDSLELPGLTAGCHVCEWRPKPNQMAAADFCGEDSAGVAHVGVFECGFTPDCQRQCNFVECLTK